MAGEAGGQVDRNTAALGIIAVGAIGIMVYLAQSSAGASLAGVPQFETEAQFSGLNTDVGARVNVSSPLDISAATHFYVGGYNCPGQTLVPPRHRYPLTCGGNVTSVINHGMSQLSQGSPDNSWRVQPPSEYAI